MTAEATPVLDRIRNEGDTTGRGILLMLGAITLFTVMDAFGKHLTASYPPMQVIWARYAGNMLIVLAVLAPRLGSVARSRRPWVQIFRGLTQLGAIVCFFFALRHVGLAETTAIMDLNPVLITLFAAVFLGEAIGPRRIAGIVVALIGAMIVIRPGAGVLHPAALFALAGAFVYATGAVLTRLARSDSTATSILWATAICTIISSAIVPFVWQPVDPRDLWAFAAMGVIGAVAQALLIRAFMFAEASTLAPFGYIGLVFATLWGWLFFDAVPDRWTVIGAGVIVSAGLYVWAREAQLAARA
ncbi:EamA family transporter [Paracoccus sp. S-4012]|nr:DMT family transporter [Paracoccus sp. S-4012]MRX51116.1 EamA family transporter [Paracoccus sp. S-4012]